MKLQTPVTDQPCKAGISYKDKILMLGSCFADSIGTMLCNYGFDAMVNPFGTLYNPMSILNSVRRLASGEPFTEEECVQMGAGAGLTCSFSHHTSFARETEEAFLENANRTLAEASAFFRECNKVIITLGTSWCYRSIAGNMIVSNCLKRPAAEFVRERMPVKRITECIQEIIGICNSPEGDGPESDTSGSKAQEGIIRKDIILTVSPIRHLADGAHGNQVSKASLLLGIEDAISGTGKADYFPSYEIFMDELRDYRFYDEDMCHPTRQAEGYILERFLGWALPSSEHAILEQNIRSFRRSRHIPITYSHNK